MVKELLSTFVVSLCFLAMTYLYIDELYKPVPVPSVQVINLSKDTTDEVLYQRNGLVIDKIPGGGPELGYRHLYWDKCRTIESVVVQTMQHMPAQVTVYYKNVCGK